MDTVSSENPRSWADRHGFGDEWRRHAPPSPGGLAAIARAYLCIAGVVLAVDTVNVLSALHDAAMAGRAMPAWRPIIGEASSAVGDIVACGLIYLALRFAMPGQNSWKRVTLVHAPMTVLFSGVHQAGLMGMRTLIHAVTGLGHDPVIRLDQLIYEYRKDLLAYAIIAVLFWLFCRPATPVRPAPVPSPVRLGSEATIDIQDGARTLRTPVGHILAVRAAGNYVEFLIDDGGRPLMRTSLRRTEAMLAAHGLVRTHRSWLVNPHRLRGITAVGSGDYRLELDGGAQAPLSRRFQAALARLRGDNMRETLAE